MAVWPSRSVATVEVMVARGARVATVIWRPAPVSLALPAAFVNAPGATPIDAVPEMPAAGVKMAV